MRQQTLAVAADGSFEKYRKPTRREIFLAEMDRIVPWAQMVALIEPRYPKAGNGRRPVGVERMLRMYFLQQWFGFSDPGGGRSALRFAGDAAVCGHRSGPGASAG